MNISDKRIILKIVKKNSLIFLSIIFVIPFICISIADLFKISIGRLYTFHLSLKDFFTLWVTSFGILGVLININISRKRLSAQQLQIDIQHKSERNKRFAEGIELLASKSASTRRGAVYSLNFLVTEYPSEYARIILEILCSHIRSLSEEFNGHCVELGDLIIQLFNISPHLWDDYRKFVDLNGVYFYRTRLTGSNLNSANLNDSVFSECSMVGTSLIMGRMVCCQITYSNLWGADLKGANLRGANFSNSNLNGIYMNEANLSDAKFIDCHFGQANLSNVQLTPNTSFYKSDLSNVNLDGATYCGTKLVNFKSKNINLLDIDSVKKLLSNSKTISDIFRG